MPPISLKHIKVILQISSVEHEDDLNNGMKKCNSIVGETNSPPIPTSSGHTQTEILIVDNRSVQLNTYEEETFPQTIISHKMSFDHVCESLVGLQQQFKEIMEQLLLQQENCCLIRFAIQHESDTVLFFDQFISNFNEYTQEHNYKLQNCHLTCSDVWNLAVQFDANESEAGATGTNNANSSSDSPINRIHGSKVLRNTTNQFRNVQTLMKWLLNDYRSKTNILNSHEKLHFLFTIYDSVGKYSFSVNLYLFNVYVNLMGLPERNHWHQYMLHMGEECLVDKCDFVHSGLTVSLSNHVEAKASKHTYFLFDIPMGANSSEDTVDMIQMADSIIKCRLKIQKVLIDKFLNTNKAPHIDQTKIMPHASQNRPKRHTMHPSYGPIPRSVAFTIPNNNNNDNDNNNDNNNDKHFSTNKPFSDDSSYTKKDLNHLQSWYQKIDENANRLCKLSETYYLEYFDKKIHNISNYLESMIDNIDLQPNINSDCYMGNNVKKMYDNYNEAKMSFEQLSTDINQTPYKDILQVYFKTKKYDIKQKAHQLQITYLRKCQADLNEYVERAVNKINCEMGNE